MTPPVASTPEGSNPQGGEQVLGQEQIVVGDVIGMMRSFHRMSEAWLENMAICFALRDYTSNMKVCMAVFQLKGERSSMVEDAPAIVEHGH